MTNEEKAFLYNEGNAYKCSFCPRNEGFNDWQGRYPCGQWHCWVSLYCEEEEEVYDEPQISRCCYDCPDFEDGYICADCITEGWR